MCVTESSANDNCEYVALTYISRVLANHRREQRFPLISQHSIILEYQPIRVRENKILQERCLNTIRQNLEIPG